MSVLLTIVGLAFVISGVLSLAKITDVGMTYLSMTKIHLLPFLNTFPSVWVYIALGVILLVIAGLITRRS